MLVAVQRNCTRSCYANTGSKLMVGSETRVICQGFTGKQVCFCNLSLFTILELRGVEIECGYLH